MPGIHDWETWHAFYTISFMTSTKTRCLILGCGNTLRSDDGIGPWLCNWAEERFRSIASIKVMVDHQWAPEVAEEVANSETVVFVDCAIDCAAGQILLREVQPLPLVPGLVTHHIGAPELLAIAAELYQAAPRKALLLTVGAGSIELGEGLSAEVEATLPDATALLELAVHQCLQV